MPPLVLTVNDHDVPSPPCTARQNVLRAWLLALITVWVSAHPAGVEIVRPFGFHEQNATRTFPVAGVLPSVNATVPLLAGACPVSWTIEVLMPGHRAFPGSRQLPGRR